MRTCPGDFSSCPEARGAEGLRRACGHLPFTQVSLSPPERPSSLLRSACATPGTQRTLPAQASIQGGLLSHSVLCGPMFPACSDARNPQESRNPVCFSNPACTNVC